MLPNVVMKYKQSFQLGLRSVGRLARSVVAVRTAFQMCRWCATVLLNDYGVTEVLSNVFMWSMGCQQCF